MYAQSLRHGRLRADGDNVWGGNTEPKIMEETFLEPFALDEQNSCIRRETIGCLTTDGSSPKHNNRIVEVYHKEQDKEVIVFDDYNNCVKSDQSTDGTLTRNCGNDAIRNGVKIVEKKECDYRVRKLTERECGRLMGVKDDDIAKIGKNLSRSAQYHCFGDSIVTTCLMAIFGQMTDIDYEDKIEETVKEICSER